jgi:hypothetical protein
MVRYVFIWLIVIGQTSGLPAQGEVLCDDVAVVFFVIGDPASLEAMINGDLGKVLTVVSVSTDSVSEDFFGNLSL